MFFTVKKFLELFPDFRLLAGADGLNHRIRNAFSADDPSFTEWGQRGDLVISSGYAFRDNPAGLADALRELARRKVAAAAIKLGVFVSVLPDEILKTADEVGIPLILVPPKIRWADILTPVIREISRYENIRQTMEELLKKLLLGERLYPEELQSIRQMLPAAAKNGCFCIVVSPDCETERKLLTEQMESFFSGERWEGCHTEIQNRLVFLAAEKAEPCAREEVRTGLEKIARAVSDGERTFAADSSMADRGTGNSSTADRGMTVVRNGAANPRADCVPLIFGVGRRKEQLTDAPVSYLEAIRAALLYRSLFRPETVIFRDELGSALLLGSAVDRQLAAEQESQYLYPLTDYDRRHGTELYATLLAVIRNDWDLKAAAAETYVHYNTMRNRFTKILALYGRERLTREDKFNIETAVKLKLLEGPNGTA